MLAVKSTKDNAKSAAHTGAINTFYGRPDIQVGADAPEAVSLIRNW
ncbi:MAG: hypothetical protein ACI8XO_005107 [Verrucomicrobiales bacterium]